MDIEITNAYITKDKLVIIEAVDVSEVNLMRMERQRDDGFEQELTFEFDTKNPKVFNELNIWLHKQKATRKASTYKEAIQAVIGTLTDISSKYRVFGY